MNARAVAVPKAKRLRLAEGGGVAPEGKVVRRLLGGADCGVRGALPLPALERRSTQHYGVIRFASPVRYVRISVFACEGGNR